MPKNIARIITILLASACLSIGCASSVDNPENENENGNENGNGNGDGNGNGNGNGQLEPEYCTGDECKEEEEFQKTGNCPQWDYVACDISNPKVRKYCDDNDKSETYGKIVTEECKDTCSNGKCVEYGDNSCDNPYLVTVDQPATGQTLSGTEYTHDQTSCSGSLKPMKGVFKITIPGTTPDFYQITASNPKGYNWGNILTPNCELKNEITSVCDTTSATDMFYAMLSPGDYYLFVAPANLFSADFEATVSVKKVDYTVANLCGTLPSHYEIIDLASGEYKTSGDTGLGSSSKNYEYMGCTQGSGGKEVAYLFSARKGQNISATLTVVSEEGKALPDKVAVYFEKCNSKSAVLKKCAEAESNVGLVSAALDVTETGEYLLYVDSTSTKDGFKYELTIKAN